MTSDTMVEIIQRKWTLSGYGTALDATIAKSYLIDAVYQVEGLDCPTSTSYTVSNGDITFDNGDPADGIGMVYVYCALSQLQNAYLHGLLDDGELGITVKSNMESVSSTAASKLHSGITEDFNKQYKKALDRLKITRLTDSPLIEIYPSDDYTENASD